MHKNRGWALKFLVLDGGKCANSGSELLSINKIPYNSAFQNSDSYTRTCATPLLKNITMSLCLYAFAIVFFLAIDKKIRQSIKIDILYIRPYI